MERPPEIVRLLSQWARWAREHPKYMTCGSGERLYRPPPCWHPPNPPANPPDLAEVLAVEKAIVNPPLPLPERVVLVGWWVYRYDPVEICAYGRRLGGWVNHRTIRDKLHKAQKMVENRLHQRGLML